ncbi:MAG: HRDC domain-containing protein [Acidimicrobiales bacterium]
MASLRPDCPEALLDIPGLGPVKAARYGSSILAIVGKEAVAG